VFAGFTGSLDRIEQIFLKNSWQVIRVDGKGWRSSVPGWKKPAQMLKGFQSTDSNRVAKLVYLAHPMSGGLAVTLTAAWEAVFFSNDFNPESRLQSIDRLHRPGMDLNKGVLITDLVNLPSDDRVLKILTENHKLQDMTMGQFAASLELELER